MQSSCEFLRLLRRRSLAFAGVVRAQSTLSSTDSRRLRIAGAFGIGMLGVGGFSVWAANAALAEENKPVTTVPGVPAAPTAEAWIASRNHPAGRLNRQSTMFKDDQDLEEYIPVKVRFQAQTSSALTISCVFLLETMKSAPLEAEEPGRESFPTHL